MYKIATKCSPKIAQAASRKCCPCAPGADPPDPPDPPIGGSAFLYNWQALIDPRGIAPEGFEVATEDDWADLLGYLGGKDVAGGKLKLVTGFDDPNTGATNEFGFDGIATGMRNPDGTFINKGKYSYHWINNTNE